MSFPSLRWIESNVWKYFLILFTGRRNFIPLLSIYYLSLPDAKAQEIGFYTAVWTIFSLVFQIPAGILGDRLGNKTAIIIGKVCLLLSSIMYVVWDQFWYFLVGSVFMSLGIDAFSTWSQSAFLHDTLTTLKKEDTFKKVSSTLRGWASFLSIFFIVGLPFLTEISLVLPFKVGLGIDIIGLLVALSLFPARWSHNEPEDKVTFSRLKTTLKKSTWSWLIPLMVFSATISAFLFVDGSFRSPYLTSIGYPIAYIGFVMWLSRLVRFVVWRFADKIEELIPFKKLMFLEIILFSLYYVSASLIGNPYLVWILFSLVTGYSWWRLDIYTDHIINLIPWKKYKSTILSIRWQFVSIIQVMMITLIGFVMTTSYKLGFLVMGISLFVFLMIVYWFFSRKERISTIDS